MLAAIEQAEIAKERGDYAIGAVVVREGQIISRGINKVRTDSDPTNHAEIVAIREATSRIKNRHLEGCVLYTTHEPCSMCTTASVYAKLDGIVYGANMEDMRDYATTHPRGNFVWRTLDIKANDIAEKGNPKIEIVGPFMRDECLKLFHSK